VDKRPAPPDDRNGGARRRILRARRAVDGRAPSPITYRMAGHTDTVAFTRATGVPWPQYEPHEGASAPPPGARRLLSAADGFLRLMRFYPADERGVRAECGGAGFVSGQD
jgi:hypothetical protein